ncbi:SIGL5 protein, partial [Atractosteus spatula]|nr:SIGL5 protein [Atractosteus spatula]
MVRRIWKNNKGNIYHNDQTQVLDSFKGRTKLVGKAHEDENCTLEINEVKTHDKGPYWLRVEIPEKDNYSFKEKYVTMALKGEPEKPVLTYTQLAHAGSAYSVTCSVRHSCPTNHPTLSWDRTDGETIVHYKDIGQGNWEVLSVLTFTPLASDHNTRLTCTAQFFKLNNPQESSITLNVKRANKKTVMFYGDWTMGSVGLIQAVVQAERIMDFSPGVQQPSFCLLIGLHSLSSGLYKTNFYVNTFLNLEISNTKSTFADVDIFPPPVFLTSTSKLWLLKRFAPINVRTEFKQHGLKEGDSINIKGVLTVRLQSDGDTFTVNNVTRHSGANHTVGREEGLMHQKADDQIMFRVIFRKNMWQSETTGKTKLETQNKLMQARGKKICDITDRKINIRSFPHPQF